MAEGQDTDVELIERIAQRDQAALRELLLRHGERVYRYALRLTQDPALAEELANDVALEVWRSATRFRYEARCSTWLLGITRFKAFNAMRGTQRLVYDEDAGVETEDERIQVDHLAVAADRRRLRQVLSDALKRLSAEHRDVLELTFFHECSYTEIAEIVGAPTATVRTRMYYAKRALRKALASSSDEVLALVGRN